MFTRYTLVLRGLEYGTKRHLRCKFLMVTHGILAHQFTPAERGLDTSRFAGPVCLAGKHNGVDCVVGTQDLTGKASSAARQLPAACKLADSTTCIYKLHCRIGQMEIFHRHSVICMRAQPTRHSVCRAC